MTFHPDRPNEPIAFLNGEVIPVSQARLHVFDLGIAGGAAVTEMVRTFGHRPFRLGDHLERLEASCRAVGFTMPKSRNELQTLSEDIVAQNCRHIGAGEELGLILFVTAGLNPTYVGPSAARAQGLSLCVHTFPLPWELWQVKYALGLALAVPPVRNLPPEVIDPRIKHRSRLHWRLADRAAREIDPAAVALVLDQQGRLSETAAGNVCLVRQGVVCSPAPGTVLEGVSLTVVGELCGQLGIPFQRTDLTLDDALAAEECFVTSTPSCLLPVTRIDNALLGSGQPGPIFSRLLKGWSDLVGVDIARQGNASRA